MVTSIRFVIYVSSFLCFFLYMLFPVQPFADENVYRDYTVFDSYERSEGGRYYYKRTQYKLMKELEGRCLFSVVDESSFPSFSRPGEQEYIVENMYAVSPKVQVDCILDNSIYKKSSLVFFDFKLDEFISLERLTHEFLAGECFKKNFLVEFDIVDFYPFSFNKIDGGGALSILADGVVYDILTEFSNDSMKIISVKKSPDINL